MENYVIICDSGEAKDLTSEQIQRAVKQIRIWSFLKALSAKANGETSNTMRNNEDDDQQEPTPFQCDSKENREQRKRDLDEFLAENKNTNEFQQVQQPITEHIRKPKTCKKLEVKTYGFNYKAFRQSIGHQKIRRNPFVVNTTQDHSFQDESSCCSSSAGSVSTPEKDVQNRKRKHQELPIFNISDLDQPLSKLKKDGVDVKLSDVTIKNICKYHHNMVRYFPKKDRSAQDQQRRDRNTEACRISRRAKKLEELALEADYVDKVKKYEKVMEESIRAFLYVNELMALMNQEENNNNN